MFVKGIRLLDSTTIALELVRKSEFKEAYFIVKAIANRREVDYTKLKGRLLTLYLIANTEYSAYNKRIDTIENAKKKNKENKAEPTPTPKVEVIVPEPIKKAPKPTVKNPKRVAYDSIIDYTNTLRKERKLRKFLFNDKGYRSYVNASEQFTDNEIKDSILIRFNDKFNVDKKWTTISGKNLIDADKVQYWLDKHSAQSDDSSSGVIIKLDDVDVVEYRNALNIKLNGFLGLFKDTITLWDRDAGYGFKYDSRDRELAGIFSLARNGTKFVKDKDKFKKVGEAFVKFTKEFGLNFEGKVITEKEFGGGDFKKYLEANRFTLLDIDKVHNYQISI